MSESKSKWCVALAALAVLAMAVPAQAQPYVYVLGKVPGSPWRQHLTVINAATNTKGPRIELGGSNGHLLPHTMAMAPDGARVYVVNDSDQTVSVVSTASNTVEDTWPTSLVGANPLGRWRSAPTTNGSTSSAIPRCSSPSTSRRSRGLPR